MSQLKMRRSLLCLIVLNLFYAICVYPLFSLATGAGKLDIVSTYRELDIAGVVNHEALHEFEEGRPSNNWRSVPDDLGEGAFLYAQIAALIIAGGFALNSLLLALMLPSISHDTR